MKFCDITINSGGVVGPIGGDIKIVIGGDDTGVGDGGGDFGDGGGCKTPQKMVTDWILLVLIVKNTCFCWKTFDHQLFNMAIGHRSTLQ